MLRRHRRRECPSCPATWPARSTRFCGRCGSPLDDVAPSRGVWPPARGWLTVAAVALSAGAIAVASLLALGDEHEVASEVDLAGPVGPTDADPPAPCVPTGCARWFAPVGAGTAVAGDEIVFHLGRDRLTALDAEDGWMRWDAPVEGPDGAGRPAGGGLDVVDDLVVHRAHRWLRAYDAATGVPKFTTGLAPQRFPRAVTPTADGLLVTGSLQADHHGSPYQFVALLDERDGRIRWSQEVHRVWPTAHGIVAEAPADRRSVVDPADGVLHIGGTMEELWPPPGAVVLQPEPDRVAVLDPADGSLRWVRRLEELAAHGSVEVVTDRHGRRELVDLATGRRHPGAGDAGDAASVVRSVAREGDHLHLAGPDGVVVVTDPGRVTSEAPLLVSTSDGLLAVDERLLTGSRG